LRANYFKLKLSTAGFKLTSFPGSFITPLSYKV